MKSLQEILKVEPFSTRVGFGSTHVQLTKCVHVEETVVSMQFWSLHRVVIDDLHRSRGISVEARTFRPFSAKAVYILTVPKRILKWT